VSYSVRVSQSIGSDAFMIVVKGYGYVHRARITKDQWMADEVDGKFGQLELIGQAAADCCAEIERQRVLPDEGT
jgi:hypothetical protein